LTEGGQNFDRPPRPPSSYGPG